MAPGDLSGSVIGERYELVRLLGQGGMGTVYEARNRATLKRCAIKLLQAPELSGRAEVVERFFRESRASSIIESDHIIQVFDSGIDGRGFPYMVMELLKGEDLEHVARRVGPLQPLAAAKLILQATLGLAKAHVGGIVHRDIKPANLFLTQKEDGSLVVKILDFGIAKVKMDAFHEPSAGLTQTGSLLGTPLYMSPEQVRRASQIDGRSDVWSLGAVLFELLSGAPPFGDQSSLGELMAAILTTEPPLIQDRAPWVAPELAEIVHRAMTHDLAHRYADAGAMRDALFPIVPDGQRLLPDMIAPVHDQQRAFVAPRLQVTHDGFLRATARTGLAATPPPSAKKSRSVSVVVVGALVALVGLAGAAFVVFGQRPASAEHPAPAAPPPAEPSKPESKSFELVVRPADARVTVDGNPTTIIDGKLAIHGAVGSTHVVKINAGGREHEALVAVASSGLVPSSIDVGAASPAAAPRPEAGVVENPKKGVRGSRPATPSAPRAASSATPKRATGLAEGTDEF